MHKYLTVVLVLLLSSGCERTTDYNRAVCSDGYKTEYHYALGIADGNIFWHEGINGSYSFRNYVIPEGVVCSIETVTRESR